MKVFEQIISNHAFVSFASAWFAAQFAIGIQGIFKEKSIKGFRRVIANGGMPSSHSSSVCALCTASVLAYGFDSFQFAVSALIALVVMNDAFGVRYETGKHSKVLKKLLKEGDVDMDVELKVAVGHTLRQVLVGAVLGIAVSIALKYLFYN
ncbi:MAG: divergent PAP2 family protein [Acutalibacteraceae bacterium]|nr:divergent PAP2 family protein [Acutalibacteraceae bacterium]